MFPKIKEAWKGFKFDTVEAVKEIAKETGNMLSEKYLKILFSKVEISNGKV